MLHITVDIRNLLFKCLILFDVYSDFIKTHSRDTFKVIPGTPTEIFFPLERNDNQHFTTIEQLQSQ